MKNKNKEQLDSFTKYCELYPEQRFWQALRNWSGVYAIYKSNSPYESLESLPENLQHILKDTYYEE